MTARAMTMDLRTSQLHKDIGVKCRCGIYMWDAAYIFPVLLWCLDWSLKKLNSFPSAEIWEISHQERELKQSSTEKNMCMRRICSCGKQLLPAAAWRINWVAPLTWHIDSSTLMKCKRILHDKQMGKQHIRTRAALLLWYKYIVIPHVHGKTDPVTEYYSWSDGCCECRGKNKMCSRRPTGRPPHTLSSVRRRRRRRAA